MSYRLIRPPLTKVKRPARNLLPGDTVAWEGRTATIADTTTLCPEMMMLELSGRNYSEWIAVGSEVLLELA